MANLENNYDTENKSTQDVVEEVERTDIPTPQKKKKWWVKLLLFLMFFFLAIVVVFFVLINRPSTQNWIANKVLTTLNKDFNIDMKANQVSVDFFGDVTIKGFKVTDENGLDFIKAKKLRANSDWYDLVKGLVVDKTNAIHFNSIVLEEADVKVITYKGDSISNFIKYVTSFDNGKKDPAKKPFHLDSDIKIKNSRVSIVNENSHGEAGKWLTATDFNLSANHLNVDGPKVSANIKDFNFVTERWGKKHIVKQLSGQMLINQEALDLKDVKLFTDHTLLKGDIRFNLPNGSWQDFVDKVAWNLDIQEGSYFSGYDISYFATNWDNYKKVDFHGKMKGSLNDFTLQNAYLGQNKFKLDAQKIGFKNILNGNFTITTPNLKTDFTYQELKGVLPTFISKKLGGFADDFGRLKFNGTARVTPKQVYIDKGQLHSGVGNAKINQLYLTHYTTSIPKYKGFVELDKLDASVIAKTDQVKKISGTFQVDGKSFDVNTMVLSTKADVTEIEILDKKIKNIRLDGTLDLKKYIGFIGVNDSQIKTKLNGEIDFKTPRIKADVAGNIQYLNLSYFTGNKEKQIVSGGVDAKIALNDLNDLELDSNVHDVRFSIDGKAYHLANADVKADIQDGKRTVFIDAPNLINGSIEGKFNLADLPDMIKNGLNKILISKTSMRSFKGQNFNMNFDMEQDLVKLFSPELELPQGANVTGSYIGNTNDLILHLKSNQLKYLITTEKKIKEVDKILAQYNDEYKIKEEDKFEKKHLLVDFISVKINTTRQEKQIDATIDRVEFKDNIFRNVELLAENNDNEYLDIVSRFDYGTPENELKGKLQSFVLNFKQFSNEKGDYVFDFKPTQVQIRDVIWNINPSKGLDHAIVFNKDKGYLFINTLNLSSDDSQISIKDAIYKNAKDFRANITVKNFQISKIFDMLPTENAMMVNGIANGTVDIIRNKRELKPLIDVKVQNVTMQDREIGTVIVDARNSDRSNVYDINAFVESSDFLAKNHLEVSGTIDNNPKSPVLDIQVTMSDFDIAFTNHFVQGVFSNLRGKTNGVLNISGPLNDVDYSGDIALKEAGLKLDFVGVDYKFEDTVLNISKGLAQLNNIGISDGRSGSNGTISGVIQFETLASMSVALFLRTENLLLLNTTQNDFDLFWGRVFATGTLFVDGPVKALNLSTPEDDGMKILDNSTFTFNSDSSSNVDEFKMLRFLKKNEQGEKVTQEEKIQTGANMNVNFTANVGKGTSLNVLLGEDIGSIRVRGASEQFNFKMTRDGNISMNGRYDVDNGMFEYTPQYKNLNLGEKQFVIERGSSINWDGNVMAPELAIKANYITSVSNVGEYLNMGNLPSVNIKVDAVISETLANPSIGLGVEAIDVSSQVKEALASKLDQGEGRLSQIVPILFTNSFNVSETGGLGVDIGAVAESSLYNMLFKRANSTLSTLDNDLDVDFNYVNGNEAYKIGSRINAGLAYRISPRFKLKGSLGIPIVTNEALNGENNNFYSKELTAEYDISKKNDRSLILRGYTKPTNIGMLNTFNNQTYGAGIAWVKNFDSIFKKNKNKSSKKTVINQKIKNDSIKK